MRRIISISVLLAVLLLSFSSTQVAAGRDPCAGIPGTPWFTHYYGNAPFLEVGDLVEAFSPRGDRVGCFAVHTPTYWGYMRVYGEDTTADPPIPGMREGEEVTLEVNGVGINTLPWVVTYQGDRDLHEVWLTHLSLRQLWWLFWLGIIP